jgi:hypothetical protein
MTKAFPPAKRVEVLLNTLRGERHLMQPLLAEVIDDLEGTQAHPAAAEAARSLLYRLDAGLDEAEFEHELARLLDLVCGPVSDPLVTHSCLACQF